ncbi:MAG: Ig-like domain-containing protein [Thermoplasmatota archaeon]
MHNKLFVCILVSIAILAPIFGSAGTVTNEASENVAIIKPEAGLYVFDVKLVPLLETPRPFQAIVVSKITVEAEADAAVSFYVDGELQHEDSEAPYTWVWDTGLQPPPIHTLRAEAGGESDEIGVLYINPFGG